MSTLSSEAIAIEDLSVAFDVKWPNPHYFTAYFSSGRFLRLEGDG